MKYDKEELVERIIRDLGENYHDNDIEILMEIFEEISSIASNVSNRDETDIKLFPHIKRAVKSVYLIRGAEGLASKSESGVSDTFENIIDKLASDIIKGGLRRVK